MSYGAQSHMCYCPAAGAEAGPANHYDKTKFLRRPAWLGFRRTIIRYGCLYSWGKGLRALVRGPKPPPWHPDLEWVQVPWDNTQQRGGAADYVPL